MNAAKSLLKSVLPAGMQSGLKKLMGQDSPIERVLEKIEKRDVQLKTLDALEVFGGTANGRRRFTGRWCTAWKFGKSRRSTAKR